MYMNIYKNFKPLTISIRRMKISYEARIGKYAKNAITFWNNRADKN